MSGASKVPLQQYACRALIALVASLAVMTGALAQTVVIEVNNTSGDRDDYLCWPPVISRARLQSPQPEQSGKQIRITSAASPEGGAVRFQMAIEEKITRSSYSPSSEITIVLPSDGAWVRFWTMGTKPSTEGKDVKIVAKSEDGTVLGGINVMVRVRKNADRLTNFETQIFLDALRKFHDVGNGSVNTNYEPYARIHQAANQLQIHRSPLFLPWHRALVLDLERRLQELDPRVAMPYWRFDRATSRVFSGDFMGVTIPGTPFVTGAGLANWIDPRMGRLVRDPVSPPTAGILDGAIPASFHSAFVIFHSQIESAFHSGVHTRIGGWLAGPASPADPLFFLLHSNVDRVWAHWQAMHDRFNPKDELAYSAQGAYPGSGPDAGIFSNGAYAEDAMWPWGYPIPQTATGWPPITHGMPNDQQHASTNASLVTPGNLIDYLGVQGRGLALGYCYDDIDFMGRTIGE